MNKRKGYPINGSLLGKKVVEIDSRMDDVKSKAFVLTSKKDMYNSIEDWVYDYRSNGNSFSNFYRYCGVDDIIPLGRVVGNDINGKKVRQGDLVSDGMDNENVYQVIDEIMACDLVSGCYIVNTGYAMVKKLNASERSEVIQSKDVLSALELSNQKVFDIEGWDYTL